MARSLPLALLALFVLGCSETRESVTPPALAFTSRPPLLLRVDEVRIQDARGASAGVPEAAVPVPPEQAVRDMLQYRLRAAGGVGAVQATILEASAVESPLEQAGGLRGYVVEEPVAELLGRLKVRLERLDEGGEPVGSLSTAVTRTAAIPESANYARRQEIAFELVQDLVNDLDIGLVSNLQQSFTTLIAPSV